LLAGGDLDVQEVVQELGVAGFLALGRLERRRERVGRGRELQVGEI
jgi:hypothetical protein